MLQGDASLLASPPPYRRRRLLLLLPRVNPSVFLWCGVMEGGWRALTSCGGLGEERKNSVEEEQGEGGSESLDLPRLVSNAAARGTEGEAESDAGGGGGHGRGHQLRTKVRQTQRKDGRGLLTSARESTLSECGGARKTAAPQRHLEQAEGSCGGTRSVRKVCLCQ